MARMPDMAAMLPEHRFRRWKRRLIASVAVLLVLSALLGDTDPGYAAAGPSTVSSLDAPWCVTSSSSSSVTVDFVSAGMAQPLAVVAHRAQPGPMRLVHALVGVPPWVIWPASPLPRIAGAFLHPALARARIAASTLTPRVICSSADAGEALSRRPALTPGWPEPFRPLDRLAGLDQRFPRPPPH